MSNEEDAFLSELYLRLLSSVCNGNNGEMGSAVEYAEEALDMVRSRIAAVGLAIEEDEYENIKVVRPKKTT